MDDSQNWVERRAQRERVLDSGAADVWNQVRAALQNACLSYNEHYATQSELQVRCSLETENKILIIRPIPTDLVTRFASSSVGALTVFDPGVPSITATS